MQKGLMDRSYSQYYLHAMCGGDVCFGEWLDRVQSMRCWVLRASAGWCSCVQCLPCRYSKDSTQRGNGCDRMLCSIHHSS